MAKIFDNISGLSENSRKLFQTKYDYWLNIFTSAGKGGVREFLRNPEQAIQVLRTTPISHSNSNHHIFISAVVALFRHNAIPKGVFRNKGDMEKAGKLWLAIQKDNSAPLRQHYIENTPTVNQIVAVGSAAGDANASAVSAGSPLVSPPGITWQDIINARNQLPRGSIDRLLFFMYTAIPPVRADYYATELVLHPAAPTADNYILIKSLKDMTLVIRNFKTARLYDDITTILPHVVCQEIVESLSANPRKWLFVAESGEPFDRKRFSEWTSRIFSRHVKNGYLTINIIRHLFISSNVDFNKPSKELEVIGRAMGHNISMQKGYQWIDTPTTN
jgi:hypothetical protein